MYAIIETGGKQYCVEEGSKILVEKLAAEAGTEVIRFLCWAAAKSKSALPVLPTRP